MRKSGRETPPGETQVQTRDQCHRERAPIGGRREFFKRAAVAGGALAVSAGSGAAVAELSRPRSAQEGAPSDEALGYRESEHVRTYYRLARM